MKVLIIGAGNMGLTYGYSFVDASVLSRDELYFLEKDESKQVRLQGISNCPLHTVPGDFMGGMDLIVLAVKPQDFSSLSLDIKNHLSNKQIILSIMAGITMDAIRDRLGSAKVVRAMPNLPAQVGQGMTVFTATEEVDRDEIFFVQNLLNTTGKTLYTSKESLLDAATAISGSGPAYVFFWMESMIQKAKQLGFDDAEAQMLVEQTFRGSIDLLHRNALSCQEWIEKVASKGGTTEAALASFESNNVESKIGEGIDAAHQRAIDLSN